MENIDYKKLENAIAWGIVKSLFIFFGIYCLINIIIFAIMYFTSPEGACIQAGNMIHCPNPEAHKIAIFPN